MVVDKRALRILTGAYWSPLGWRPDPSVAPEDFAYAKAQGVMFDPILLTHDQAVDAAINAVSGTTHEAAASAFVASLGSRRLDLRSALGFVGIHRELMTAAAR